MTQDGLASADESTIFHWLKPGAALSRKIRISEIGIFGIGTPSLVILLEDLTKKAPEASSGVARQSQILTPQSCFKGQLSPLDILRRPSRFDLGVVTVWRDKLGG